MQDNRETQTKFSTWRKKTVIPYICRSIFQTNYPIADYYKFYKNTNPLQADIQKINNNPYIRIISVTKSAGSTIFLKRVSDITVIFN